MWPKASYSSSRHAVFLKFYLNIFTEINWFDFNSLYIGHFISQRWGKESMEFRKGKRPTHFKNRKLRFYAHHHWSPSRDCNEISLRFTLPLPFFTKVLAKLYFSYLIFTISCSKSCSIFRCSQIVSNCRSVAVIMRMS